MTQKHNPIRGRFHSLRHFILERLIEANDAAIDAFFPPGYPGTALARSFLSRHWRSRSPSAKKCSALLSKLQKEGLVRRSGSRRYASWRITSAGKKAVGAYRRTVVRKGIPLFDPIERDGVIRIVSFDVPERERAKRGILRDCLKEAGFRQLQKSVWIGTAPLPDALMQYFREQKILSYIHIADIRHSGTLESGK